MIVAEDDRYYEEKLSELASLHGEKIACRLYGAGASSRDPWNEKDCLNGPFDLAPVDTPNDRAWWLPGLHQRFCIAHITASGRVIPYLGRIAQANAELVVAALKAEETP